MSSLQKFHRRTNAGAPAVKLIGSEAPVAGAGFYLGLAGDGISYMYVAPKSTEAQRALFTNNTAVASSTTDGVLNSENYKTSSPAVIYCKSLTTGGYSWYLPARNELYTCFSNKTATPFATANGFGNFRYITSTNGSGNYCTTINMPTGGGPDDYCSRTNGAYYVRATRRALV
jgi:hypothetical protein